jgi:hypothetical protein
MAIASNRNNLLYWVFTGIFCFFMLPGAIFNIMSSPDWVEVFKQLGYPLYLLPFLGVAKLLGVIALLVPGYPRIREWAYAGMFFDLVGAVYSGLMAMPGAFDPKMLFMVLPFLFGGLSYIYHHKILAAKA